MLMSSAQSGPSFGRDSPVGIARQPKRPTGGRDGIMGTRSEKEPLWIPMLQSASKGKDLSEKQMILLGGSPDIQREFLEQLNPDASSRLSSRINNRRGQKLNIPISNRFALGYTYHNVLDADQEDILARMNVHMLTNTSGKFATLLRPLLTVDSIKDTIVTILLDWNDPFTWPRYLRQWIRLLRKTMADLDTNVKIALEENTQFWKGKRVGTEIQLISQQDGVPISGPGEWDEALGIPICVVCVQSEKIERLERDLGWGDDQFDFLQQWLRTILLKHGGSLVYTASFEPNHVRSLIHANLQISSLLKREVIKHNVIDRDKILIPPNWDSWGKIRILREGFDPEVISNAWSVEIQEAPLDMLDLSIPKISAAQLTHDTSTPQQPDNTSTSAVAVFEQSLPNPVEDATNSNGMQGSQRSAPENLIIATPFQDFLQAQLPILEKYKAEDAAEYQAQQQKIQNAKTPTVIDGTSSNNNNDTLSSLSTTGIITASGSGMGSGSMSPTKGGNISSSLKAGTTLQSSTYLDTIGPHRVNVNGIDLDAEEATRRLTEREHERNALRRAGSETVVPGTANATGSPGKLLRGMTEGNMSPVTAADGKHSNEALRGFFANLIIKGEQKGSAGGSRSNNSAMGSGNASPRRESPAPNWRREE